jgi:hypothetical protein
VGGRVPGRLDGGRSATDAETVDGGTRLPDTSTLGAFALAVTPGRDRTGGPPGAPRGNTRETTMTVEENETLGTQRLGAVPSPGATVRRAGRETSG